METPPHRFPVIFLKLFVDITQLPLFLVTFFTFILQNYIRVYYFSIEVGALISIFFFGIVCILLAVT